MTESRSLGVFGGSFDPVHNGHIRAAELVQQALELDQVIFVPAGKQWQKNSTTSAADRLSMLRLALADHSGFVVSEIDIARGGNTYTIDTLRELQDEHQGDKLFFILGTDALSGIESWKNADELLDKAQFVVVSRPGSELVIPPIAKGRVWSLEIPALDISSTDFREKFGLGTDYEALLPERVLTYIREHNLYSEKREDD